MLDQVYLLPQEDLNDINFPLVAKYKTDIANILAYGLIVHEALHLYNVGSVDKIDINLDELKSNIDKCRSICRLIGDLNNSSAVCFEVLIELRKIQKNMQNVWFLGSLGPKYIGKPDSAAGGDI